MELDEILKILKENNEAIEKGAGQAFSEQELRGFVDSLSVKVAPDTKVLMPYSGPDGQGGLYTFQVAKEMAGKIPEIGIVDNTSAMQLVNHKSFVNAIDNAAGRNNRGPIFKGISEPDGTRIKPGLVDEVSSRFFASNPDHPVMGLTPFPENRSVYVQNEFSTIIDTPGAPFEGLPRSVFQDIRDGAPNGITDARLAASATSLERMGGLSYHMDSNGQLLGVDTSNYWPSEFSDLAHQPSATSNTLIVSQADLIKDINPAQQTDIARGIKLLDDAVPGQELGFIRGLGKNGGFVVGAVVGTGLAAHELITGTPAQAAEIFYESTVPYGETQIDLARMDLEAAAHSATVETASNVGCIVVGGLAGGAVTYFSAGAAVPTGVTVSASVGGCLVGGATVGFATNFALDSYDAVTDSVDTAIAAISDLFNDASGTENLQNPPALDADFAHAALPDQLQPGMPPEVESLILFKSNRDMFDRQFDEISEYGGLPEVEGYIEQKAALNSRSEPDLTPNVETPAQASAVPASSYTGLAP